jgi:thiamine monophosphate synthase
MTDERIGDRLWQAIDRLPPGEGGIVFRHYRLGEEERRQLGGKVAGVARERQLVLAVAGDLLAHELGAALVHNPVATDDLPVSMAVHDEREAGLASIRGAALAFIGPVHGTRSHPSAIALGPERAAKLARLAGCPTIALGGMDSGRFDALAGAFPGMFHGYAGIDCWLG